MLEHQPLTCSEHEAWKARYSVSQFPADPRLAAFPGCLTMLEMFIWVKPKQALRLEVTGHPDKMLRRIGDKEFPSLESENVRAGWVLGDQLASSPRVTDRRLRPREGERLPKVTQPVWKELGSEPRQTVWAKFGGNP